LTERLESAIGGSGIPRPAEKVAKWLNDGFQATALRPLKLFLNGSWFGHPLHPVLTDIPIGATHMFAYPTDYDPCVLVRSGEQTFVAYSQECTHLSCAVVPNVAEGVIRCPCHEGVFDLATGRPLAGPPRRPLSRVRLAIRGGEIVATGIEERTV